MYAKHVNRHMHFGLKIFNVIFFYQGEHSYMMLHENTISLNLVDTLAQSFR